MHRCPKCKTTELITLPDSTEGMLFFRCATCGREFAKKEGQTITERWLSPISVALYGAIFNRSHEQAVSIAQMLVKQHPRDFIDRFLTEATDELGHPSQQLTHMLPFAGSPTEEGIRAFLRLVVEAMRDATREHG